MEVNSVIISVIVAIALFYWYTKKKFSYWADRDVPFVKPVPIVGTSWGLFVTKNMGEMLRECYKELKGKDIIGGLYFLTRPAVLTLDLDLLSNIFVKDFNYFRDRGLYVNPEVDPMTSNMFFMGGDAWKGIRTKLSPTFTSGKMKMMHAILMHVADQFTDHLDRLAENKEDFDLKDVLARFTTDIISNVAFGVECNSLKDPGCDFRKAGKKIFDLTSWDMMRQFFCNMFPSVGRKLGISFFPPGVSDFFLTMLRDTVDYREKNNIVRNDFLSLLLQLKNTGKLNNEDVDLGRITFDELASQVFLFFAAGFETSSSTMSYALYELALNEDIQERARLEVKSVLKQHNGQFTYEACMQLQYIDQIVKGKHRLEDIYFGL